jgi:hypothetical protein
VNAFEIDPRTRDLAPEALTPDGRPRVLPASYWATTTPAERAILGHRHGIYSYPTTELVAWLKDFIGDRTAIEIGAGHGCLAAALNIPATDSMQQNKPKYRAEYAAMGQPPVRYGENIIPLDARGAISRYHPQVVVACWVTHRYSRRRHWAGGNEAGVDEAKILDSGATYVFVGNERVHAGKPIWDRPHEIMYPPWVCSRAINGSRDFVATWGRP